MIHSINLLVPVVSDRKWWCEVQVGGRHNYYVRNRSLELEDHKPSDPPGSELQGWGQLNRHSGGVIHNPPYCHKERDDEILQDSHWVSSSAYSKWLILAYGSDGEPKEHGGKRHEAIDPLPPRKPLPLDVAGSDQESDEDAYTIDPALAQESLQPREGTECSPYITHSKNVPRRKAEM